MGKQESISMLERWEAVNECVKFATVAGLYPLLRA
jgi:hypothetical protein